MRTRYEMRGFNATIRGKCAWQIEQVCKPNSVLQSISELKSEIWNDHTRDLRSKSEIDQSGDHSSSPIVADRIKRSTRRS